jgi:8-oxo-dGTP pyrophosphatase MutT (NUDIX family)
MARTSRAWLARLVGNHSHRSAYAASMLLPSALRRPLYRCAYALLRVYWFLARPAVAGVKAVLTDGPLVLLVRHTYGPGSWDFPGGAIKRRELPVSAVRREMAEELGVTIEDWRALGEIKGRMNHRRDTLHCFRAELSGPALTPDAGELAAAQWFPSDQLPAKLGGYARQILELLDGAP